MNNSNPIFTIHNQRHGCFISGLCHVKTVCFRAAAMHKPAATVTNADADAVAAFQYLHKNPFSNRFLSTFLKFLPRTIRFGGFYRSLSLFPFVPVYHGKK